MSDFWRILAISAYGSALAWRSRAVSQGHSIAELRPLESYSNLQKATADYRTIEAEALSVLTDSGGGGPVNWEDILNVPDEFNPEEHAFTHALGGIDPIYPLTIGARPTGVNIPWGEVEAPSSFTPSSHALTHAEGGIDAITPESINACELTGGLIPINRLPPLAITDRFLAVSDVEMIALAAQLGDICYRSDQGRYYQKVNTDGLITDWVAWLDPPVLSVNGLNGDVVLPPLIPAPHAITHHLGGTDPISAEEIGAELAGAVAEHKGGTDPHPQYAKSTEASLPLLLGNNWSMVGTLYLPTCQKFDNLVLLSGAVNNSNSGSRAFPITTLPVGYRPSAYQIFSFSGYITPGFTSYYFDVRININGQIILTNQWPNSSATVSFLTLSGISFFAA